jgi:ParB family chromosome partitioning protein
MQPIKLSSLTISKAHNVRKTDRERGLEELVASIRSHGLLENLIVIPANDKKKFEVIAGGRRLLAMQTLQKEGELPASHEVQCEVVDAEKAKEISLAENMVRTEMHPADQFEAYAKLIDQGMTVSEVAARFGVTDLFVQKRLKLGRISPKLIKAYRAEKLSLDVLMAFALTDDHKVQESLYKRVKDSWEIKQPHSIRNALTETAVRSNNKFAKFVGLEAYEEAGGTYLKDLFSEQNECYLEDVPLLQKLAEEKLHNLSLEIKDKWKWVEAKFEFGYDEKSKYHRIYQHPIGDIPEELITTQKNLENQLEALESEEDVDDAEVERIQEELSAINEKLSSYHGFSEEDYATAGCVLSISYNGELDINEGLVRPEDRISNDNTGTKKSTETKASLPFSQSLIDRLKNHRLQAVRQYMAQDYEVAFDSALYLMCMQTIKPSYYGKDWLKIRAEKYNLPHLLISEDPQVAALQAEEETMFNSLPLAWLNINDEVERFHAFCELNKHEKQQLFAACVSKALQPQLSIELSRPALFEIISNRLCVDVAKHWRPTKANFFDRVTKKDLLELGQEIFGENWVKINSKKPKGDVAYILDNAFSNPEQNIYTIEQQEKLKTWLPKGMTCEE